VSSALYGVVGTLFLLCGVDASLAVVVMKGVPALHELGLDISRGGSFNFLCIVIVASREIRLNPNTQNQATRSRPLVWVQRSSFLLS
jgi:hypothetical protein